LPSAIALSLAIFLVPDAATAAPSPSLAAVQAQVDRLQNEAADAAEAANGAQVRLTALQHTLAGVQDQRAKEGAALKALKKNLGMMAANAYKNGGLGAGIQLLFAQDPTQYLSSASQLEAVSRTQAVQLRRYTAAEQRFHQTSLVVGDRVKLVQATQRELAASAALAQSKLAAVERLLNSLKSSQRKKYLAVQAAREKSSKKSSMVSAKLATTVSGRAGIALRFALQQIGKPYVFGASGLRSWDCSGLTMVAFAHAGVSLPHSSQAQINYGRRIPLSSLQPGDLVFFYRSVTHVGIYLGHGLMVNAPRPGSSVRVDRINTMPIAGAVRL
jgi:cell wall-associated NlpC family hydrolase